MLSAASALRWTCNVLGQPSEAALLDSVASLSPLQRARAPLFLPYLSGDRTPHNDADAQGVLFGLTHDHDAAAIGYAVLEGVSFSLLDGWRSLAEERLAVPALSLIGGGARSDLWAQMLASLLAVAMRSHDQANACGAVGAARLAWLADGGNEREVCKALAIRKEFLPNPVEASLLSTRHERFRALYPALRGQFGAHRAMVEASALAVPAEADMATVLVCGEALMDVFALGDTPTGMALEARVGGSPLNVAIGLARLGRRSPSSARSRAASGRTPAACFAGRARRRRQRSSVSTRRRRSAW